MKSLFALLALGLALATAQPAAAQSSPPVAENTVPHLYPAPALLTSQQVYPILVHTLGLDPFLAAEIITHSEAAYGLYYTLDDALALLPDLD